MARSRCSAESRSSALIALTQGEQGQGGKAPCRMISDRPGASNGNGLLRHSLPPAGRATRGSERIW